MTQLKSLSGEDDAFELEVGTNSEIKITEGMPSLLKVRVIGLTSPGIISLKYNSKKCDDKIIIFTSFTSVVPTLYDCD
jgi:hypothetical protein